MSAHIEPHWIDDAEIFDRRIRPHFAETNPLGIVGLHAIMDTPDDDDLMGFETDEDLYSYLANLRD